MLRPLLFFVLLPLAGALAPLSKTALLYKKKDAINKWRDEAIQKMWEERRKMDRTPLVSATKHLHGFRNVDLFLKNESAARTHSLKHRYAWALVMWALVEGHIKENTTVFETSSGNTAYSEAYMCRLIGVKFVAIVPDTIERVKVEHIEEQGASIFKVPIGERLAFARNITQRHPDRFFMNQFANADRAEEFHESGDYDHESVNVFHEILHQLQDSFNRSAPDFFVHAAGTGGTISSVGRYAKKYNVKTRIVLADSEYSIYYDYVVNNRFRNESGSSLWVSPGMAGIGFGPMGAAIHGVSTSLAPSAIDMAIKIPDLASVAAMHYLKTIGIEGGTSTGVNFVASLHLASKFSTPKRRISIVTLLADHASSYDSSYYNKQWIQENFAGHGSFECWFLVLHQSINLGVDPLQLGAKCSRTLQRSQE